MKISVTQEHIDKGEVRCALHCALVLAFNALGFDVMVEPASVSFYSSSGDFLGELALPIEAQYFQIDFDKGKPVQPFAFEMPGLTSDLRSLTFDFVPVPVVTP
jgi:hypothetical protein